jgi:hypothetical protein
MPVGLCTRLTNCPKLLRVLKLEMKGAGQERPRQEALLRGQEVLKVMAEIRRDSHRKGK